MIKRKTRCLYKKSYLSVVVNRPDLIHPHSYDMLATTYWQNDSPNWSPAYLTLIYQSNNKQYFAH